MLYMKNTPTIETLAREYRTALDVAESLEAGARTARECATDFAPVRRDFFTEGCNKAEAHEAHAAAYRRWKAEYADPAAKKAEKAAAARLYVSALAELLRDRVRLQVYENILSPSFIEKYAGLPARYKRVQKAIFAGLPECVSMYIHDANYAGGMFEPYHDEEACYRGRVRIDEFSLPGMKYIGCNNYIFDAERLEAQRDNYAGRDKWPAFSEVWKACEKAPSVKARTKKIMSDAREKYYAALEANNAGIGCINEAMKG
jgi:hypothetical protein